MSHTQPGIQQGKASPWRFEIHGKAASQYLYENPPDLARHSTTETRRSNAGQMDTENRAGYASQIEYENQSETASQAIRGVEYKPRPR